MCGAPYWLSLTFANFVFLCFQLLIWGGTCQTEEPEKLECGKAEYTSENGNCTPCVLCPPGKEPDRACGFGRGEGVSCQSCAPGTFSNRLGMSFCTPLTQCDKRKRMLLSAGTPKADAVCGGCLSGYFSPVANSASTCFPCWLAPINTTGCEGRTSLRSRALRTLEVANKPDPKMPANTTSAGARGDSNTQYAVLAIVPIFCLMGLMGIFLCNILKKKGYHCTSQKELEEQAPPLEKNALNHPCLSEENGNEDTIGVLVRLISEKKENAAALEELLKEYESKQPAPVSDKGPDSRLLLLPQMPHLCKHQHHLHTVQGPALPTGSCCSRCSQKKWTNVPGHPESAPNSVAPTAKASKAAGKVGRQGEITILAVGRFRVARIPEQKPSSLEVKAPCDPRIPEPPCEQHGLLSKTIRGKNRSLEDTSKLEDVI
uniref:Tumor necrosis factor receptor superfamily member 19L n=1 Tax=Xenopus tropicalis TaxID=8364 RepID=A0A803JLC2_XENTR